MGICRPAAWLGLADPASNISVNILLLSLICSPECLAVSRDASAPN